MISVHHAFMQAAVYHYDLETEEGYIVLSIREGAHGKYNLLLWQPRYNDFAILPYRYDRVLYIGDRLEQAA